jgi:uncharacterized protein YkwD
VTRLAKPLALASILACVAGAAAEAQAATLVSPLAGQAARFARTDGTDGAGGTRGRARSGRPAGCAPTSKHRAKGSRPCRAASHRRGATHRPAPVHKAKPKEAQPPVPTPTPTPTGAGAGAKAGQAGTIAKVLATPCQNTQLTPEPSNLALIRAAVLCLVNTERAQNGREPLQTNARLQAAAEDHGREMIADDYFAHVSPSGLTPVDRVRQAGYLPGAEVGYVVGENLAWGTLSLSTPASIVSAWIASPEHLANILEGQYRETGIDVQPQAPASLAEHVQGALYTQEFGVIVH